MAVGVGGSDANAEVSESRCLGEVESALREEIGILRFRVDRPDRNTWELESLMQKEVRALWCRFEQKESKGRMRSEATSLLPGTWLKGDGANKNARNSDSRENSMLP